MDKVEKVKHVAAASLQRFVNARIASGTRTQIHDPEAIAVIEAITECVIVQFHAMLEQAEKERVGNG